MTALLVATYVGEGRLGWDQPVVDAWAGFRAPTDELTRTLRVRDLFGMASGLGETRAVSALHEGDPTAAQLLQSNVNLPVINRPGQEFSYNTVYAVGGYLPFQAAGVDLVDLPAAYAMRDRLYRPAGMSGARIADHPRARRRLRDRQRPRPPGHAAAAAIRTSGKQRPGRRHPGQPGRHDRIRASAAA